ncbi:GNAT family N-acetyltransferase [Demequina litorisediminis]|uniref:N-acetyltransferase domain-containing protein n=1 Tax=Demequina litorisediminis TaxID=1849022 RepID=A0ABQ6I9T1_9MICO|nr:hypothetical protein GCM10025876_02840 [Demequina litorisediminis]
MTFADSPVLENARVRLEPLGQHHCDALAEAVAVDDLWRTWVTTVPAPHDMQEEIDRRLARQAAGEIAAWAIVNPASGSAVGMTTYLNLDTPNRRLEIGSTWLGRDAQRTGINPAAKAPAPGPRLRRPRMLRRRVPYALAQPPVTCRHRAPGRQARRRAALSRGVERRDTP